MKPGQQGDVFVLLADRTRRQTRDGKPYFSLRFRDRKRTASVPVWEDSPLFEPCEKEWQAGQHFKIRGIYNEHPKFGPQIEILAIRPAVDEDRLDGYDPDQFVTRTRYDVEGLFKELLSFAQSIADEPLRRLTVALLEDHEEAIKEHPAATRNHHSYRGGYLEHTVSVVQNGVFLADKYAEVYTDLDPPLNRDLILAGCILHDIGKLKELAWEAEASYTIPGQLIGHILIGRDMVREAARSIAELNPELLLYLEHIITAHQGTPEWGSPKEPMLPEALLVHFADDVDAKMNMFVQILAAHEGEGPFTDTNNVLRRRILKSRKV